MIKKRFKQHLRPIYSFFLFLPFRYSIYFPLFKNFFGYSARHEMIKISMDFITQSKIEGDYLEFGVYQGDTFISAYHFAQKRNLKSMRFYAFDSFQGLPEIVGDDNRYQEFEKGQYLCGVDEFKKNIIRGGVDIKKTKIITGWYNETLNNKTKAEIGIEKAAVIYIDCDLYESTVPVLDFITDYVQDGTIIAFDDWFCWKGSSNLGEQKAFREWLEKNPKIMVTEYHKFDWHGNSFIIHLN